MNAPVCYIKTAADSKIAEKTTDKDGNIKFDKLYLGKYYIKEISTLDEYVLDENKYSFELKYKDQYTPVIVYSKAILNTLYSFFNISCRESASKMVNNKNKDEFYISVYMTLKRLMLGGLLLIIGFLPLIFNIMVNKNYNESYLYIPFILISVYFSSLASFSSGIFSAYKDTKILAVIKSI